MRYTRLSDKDGDRGTARSPKAALRDRQKRHYAIAKNGTVRSPKTALCDRQKRHYAITKNGTTHAAFGRSRRDRKLVSNYELIRV